MSRNKNISLEEQINKYVIDRLKDGFLDEAIADVMVDIDLYSHVDDLIQNDSDIQKIIKQSVSDAIHNEDLISRHVMDILNDNDDLIYDEICNAAKDIIRKDKTLSSSICTYVKNIDVGDILSKMLIEKLK